MDKRFWSGAVAVVTVVIAGAGVLPSLLLRPAVDDDPMAGSVEPAPFMSKPVKLVDYEPLRPVAVGLSTPLPQAAVALPSEPKPETRAEVKPAVALAPKPEVRVETRAEPKPAGVVAAPPMVITPVVQVAAAHAVAPAAPAPRPVHEVSAAAVPAAPVMTTAPVSAAVASASRVAVAVFPPIQPVGVAGQSGLDAQSKPAVAAKPRETAAKPVRERVVRQAAPRERAKPRRYGRPVPFPIRQFLAALRR